MAKSLNIYPIADTTVNHSKEPSSSTNAYTLIYDVTPDDDSTYVYQALERNSTTSAKSTFKCGDSSVTGKIYLRNITSYCVRAKYYESSTSSVTANIDPCVKIGSNAEKSGNSVSLSDSYTNKTGTYSNISGLNTIYNSINDANIVLGFTTSGQYSSSSTLKGSAQIRVTQAYLTISYDDVFDVAAFAIAGSGIASVSVSTSEAVDGDTVTFTATLDSGMQFDGWYSDAACTNRVSTNATYQQAITQDTTLYARGSALYNINVVADSYSTVTSTAAQAPLGTSVTVTATVTDPNRRFDGWYSNPHRTTLVSSSNPYTFTVSGDTTLYANTATNETLYVKVNGNWVAVSKAFRKVNGQWVEQTTLSGLFDTTKNYKIINVN